MSPPPPSDRRGFEIALICALPLEADCVEAVFDKFWEDEDKDYGKAPGDYNSYTTGVIGEHNVVLAYMPGMGKVNAANVASSMRFSFPCIKLAVVVGVCGGVPFLPDGNIYDEIRLGDVIVSQALVQYDFGRRYPAAFQRKDTIEDSLSRPGPEIQSVLAKLQTLRSRQKMRKDIAASLSMLQVQLPAARQPSVDTDKLYESSYLHKHRALPGSPACPICNTEDQVCSDALQLTCDELGCDSTKLLSRQTPNNGGNTDSQQMPNVHFGRIGSGDTVVKSGEMRDRLARADDIIAFEMEGAGLWEYFPSIVVKGVCDYADSHKNKIWQRYAAATAACCMKALLSRWTREDQSQQTIQPASRARIVPSVEPAGPPKPIWHVPFKQMPHFVGRENEILTLQTQLSQPGVSRSMAVFGLGGVGKSRIAWELAKHAASLDHPYSVFWVQANSHSSLEKDYLEIGEKLAIPGIKDKESDVKLLVKQQLSRESTGNWLMIVDNADDEAIWSPKSVESNSLGSLADCIPQSTSGCVLITTRSRRVAVHLARQEVIELRQMDPNEAAETLKSRLVNPDLTADHEATLKLADHLSYLPLAIVHAASYINMNDLSIHDYLVLLSDSSEDNIIELLSEDFGNEPGRQQTQDSVASTWWISFRQIQRNHPRAIEYLSYMSCLSEKNIPHSLLPEVSSQKELMDIIGTLTGYSFIRKQTKDQSFGTLYDVHRLVRLATRSWLKLEGSLRQCTEDTMYRVAELFPSGEHEERRKWILYMPHAQMLCDASKDWNDRKHFKLLRKIGLCLFADGAYQAAIKCFSSIIAWYDGVPDDELSLDGLEAHANLGQALAAYGDWIEAEECHLKALEGRRRILGLEHPSTLYSMTDLATTLWEQGRWSEAETIEIEVIGISKRVRGPKHPETLVSMTNLASTYAHQGRWEEAENLEIQVVEMSSDVLGREHPDTLTSIANLASTKTNRGKWKEAEILEIEVLETSKRVLGHEHPDTLTSMGNLASTYRAQGRLDESRSLGAETLELRKRILGFNHPATLITMDTLGRTMLAQGFTDEALAMMRECVKLSIARLGPNHPQTKNRTSTLHYLTDLREDEDREARIYISDEDDGERRDSRVLEEKPVGDGGDRQRDFYSNQNMSDSTLNEDIDVRLDELKHDGEGSSMAA